ncbi:MAG: ECF transporter S component [Bacillota bacterium]
MKSKLGLTTLARAAVMLGLAIAIQSLSLSQWVTGPAINAILSVASASIGWAYGALVGCLTPWMALVMGILKFAPAAPVVMAGNVTLCLAFGLLYRANKYAAAGVASLLKFLVMTAGMRLIIARSVKVPAAVMASLTVTQLYTALIGTGVALILLQALGKTGVLFDRQP